MTVMGLQFTEHQKDIIRMFNPNILLLTPNEASDGPKYDAQEAKKTVERLVILL